MGRPKVWTEEHSKVTVYVPVSLRPQLEIDAEGEGLTLSGYLLRIITDHDYYYKEPTP